MRGVYIRLVTVFLAVDDNIISVFSNLSVIGTATSRTKIATSLPSSFLLYLFHEFSSVQHATLQ